MRLPRCIAAFSVAAFIKLEYVVGNSFEMKKYVPLQAAPSRRNVIIKILTDVDAALMFLWNGVIEEKGLIERRADGRKACLIHRAAILRRQLCVFMVAAAPRGCDICKGSFHFENLHFYNVVGQPFSPALFQSWKRGRLWRIYPRRLPEKKHSRGRRSRAKPPHTAGRSPLDSPLPPVLDYGRRRGI